MCEEVKVYFSLQFCVRIKHFKFQTLCKTCPLTSRRFSDRFEILRGRVNKNQPNLFLGEIDLFFFDVIAL